MKRRNVVLLIVVVAAGLAGLLIWRFTGAVEVRIEAVLHDDLPFDAETIPPVVWARPGEVVKVIYRIRNRDVRPLEAFGRYEIVPGSASDQIQIFLTQCGGLNTFQKTVPSDYEVLFRVQPAGLFGSSFMTLRHVFNRATLR